MIQKNRWRLFIVGVLMVSSLAVAAFVPLFWAPGIILLLTGCYLIVWATLGKGVGVELVRNSAHEWLSHNSNEVSKVDALHR